jgi:hypothetical protein
MHMFDRANQSLRQDLEAYHRALRTIVVALPRAQALCDRVMKEIRLMRALLAFFPGPEGVELEQLAFRLTNLWPYRDQPFARTLGFADEIAEAQQLHNEALRGVRMLIRQTNDPVASELSTCFSRIAQYLEDERSLLAECHQLIQPHTTNMHFTRKRLELVSAMVDARLPNSPDQQGMLQAYNQAVTLLADWEKGVPLEERGVAILESCLDMLDRIDGMVGQNGKIVFEQLPPAEVQATIEPRSQGPASAAVVSSGDPSSSSR